MHFNYVLPGKYGFLELSQVLEIFVNGTLLIAGGFPQLTNNIWLSRDERESAVNALLPRLQKSRSALEETLFELVALETALQENVDAVLLATLMPKRWSEFIREGPKEIVDDLGTIRRGSGSF